MDSGRKIKVAVIDTGLAKNSSFDSDVIGGCKFWIEQQTIFMSDEWEDKNGHGTMVAAIIKRYCPDSLLYIVNIYGENRITNSVLLLQALEHLLEVDVEFINISLAISSDMYINEISEVMYKLQMQGKCIFVSVKNGELTSFPANSPYCYGVKSIDDTLLSGYVYIKDEEIELLGDGMVEYVEELNGLKRWFGGNSKATAKILGICASLVGLLGENDIINKEYLNHILLNNAMKPINKQVLVKVINLGIKWEDRNRQVGVIKDLNWEIMKGEFVAVIVENANCYKALLRVFAGKDRATYGGVIVENTNIIECKEEIRKTIFIEEKTEMEKTVIEKIIHPNIRKSINKEYLHKVTKCMGIKGFENTYPEQLSAIQRLKILITQALMTKPEIILMEKPNLYVEQLEDIYELLRKITDEFAISIIMFSKHIVDDDVFDRVLRIQEENEIDR